MHQDLRLRRELFSLVFVFFLAHSSFATGENKVVEEDASNPKPNHIVLPPIFLPPIVLPPIVPPPIRPPPFLPPPIYRPPVLRPPIFPWPKKAKRSIFLPPGFLPPTTPPLPSLGSPCGGNANYPNEGFCVLGGTCRFRGGVTIGRCAGALGLNLGDCCSITEMCNENRTQVIVNQLVTKLVSPNPATTQCTFRFRKEPNICQIRLDFNAFQLRSADGDGICTENRLRISNSVTVPNGFTTCGTFTERQHMYLSFGTQDVIEINPMIKNPSSRYEILATKIPCDSVNRAPDYCLQYYTKPTDTVRSFDFPRQQQSNQQYTVCVKPSGQTAQVEWKPCTMGTGNQFFIMGSPSLPVPPTRCTTDWVQVKGRERNCESFGTITSDWKPYELLVNFDYAELPPPPVGFETRIPAGQCNPTNCPANVAGPVDCFCVGATQAEAVCQCTVTGRNPMSSIGDFNNTGFCLEYTQQ